jgi:hypothetical protein
MRPVIPEDARAGISLESSVTLLKELPWIYLDPFGYQQQRTKPSSPRNATTYINVAK